MKKSIFALALMLLATGAVFTSCTSSAEKVEATKEDIAKAEADLAEAEQAYTEEYNKFRLESKEKIAAYEKLIAVLKEASKTKSNEEKVHYENTIADLEAKNQELKADLLGYPDEDQTKWEAFKIKFTSDMESLGQALKDLTTTNTK